MDRSKHQARATLTDHRLTVTVRSPTLVNPAILPVMGVGYPSRMMPFPKDPSIKSQQVPSPYGNSVFNGRGMPGMVPDYYSPWDQPQQEDPLERSNLAGIYSQGGFMVPGPRRDEMGLINDGSIFKTQTRTSPLYGPVSPQRSASLEKVKPRHAEYDAASHSRSTLLEEFRSNKNNRKFELQVQPLSLSLSLSLSHSLPHASINSLTHACVIISRTLSATLSSSARTSMVLASSSRSSRLPTCPTSNSCLPRSSRTPCR